MSEYSVREACEEDASAIAGIRVASWRRTYSGIVPDEALAAMDVDADADIARVWLAQTTSGTRGPLALALVVEDERGEAQGFAHGGAARPLQSGAAPEPFEGEVYALYLAPGYERRGLGGRLLGAAARRLRAHGARSLSGRWSAIPIAVSMRRSAALSPTRRRSLSAGGMCARLALAGATSIASSCGWRGASHSQRGPQSPKRKRSSAQSAAKPSRQVIFLPSA